MVLTEAIPADVLARACLWRIDVWLVLAMQPAHVAYPKDGYLNLPKQLSPVPGNAEHAEVREREREGEGILNLLRPSPVEYHYIFRVTPLGRPCKRSIPVSESDTSN